MQTASGRSGLAWFAFLAVPGDVRVIVFADDLWFVA
jgi:hypothetical protein